MIRPAMRVVLILGGLLASSQVASAATPLPDVASKEASREAREHYQRGVTHYDLNELAAALEQFKAAYRVIQDPSLLFNIAQCHRRLGQNGEALSFYRNYLRRQPDGAHRGEADKHVQELERGTAPVMASPPATTAPPPQSVLAPSTATPAGPPALVTAPVPVTSPAPTVPGPAQSTGPSGRRIGAVIAAGTGVLAIGIGSAVALAARSSYNGVIDRCPDRVCTSLDDKHKIDAARSRGDLATGIWIGGLAALTAGTVLWLTAPHGSSDLTATAWASPSGGGLALTGVTP